MMRRPWLWITVLAVTAAVSVGLAVVRRSARRPSAAARLAAAEARYHREVLPVLTKYCWDCHGDGARKGDLSLDGFTNLTAVLQDRKVWERVLDNVKTGAMPPKKKPQPATAEKELVVQWVDQTLFPVDPENPDPGRVTLRRLNRVEYDNTIRDLVGIDFKPAADFPQDDVGYGFDNIGDVLSLPPVLWERYLRAAEMVLDEAIVSGPRPPKARLVPPSEIQGHVGNSAVATLSSNGEMHADVLVSHDGEYEFKVKAYGDQAGPEKVRMAVKLDGKPLEEFEVRRGKNDPKFYEHRVAVEPGKHRVSVAFLNDYYLEKEVEVKRPNGGVRKEKRIEDRNLQVLGIEVVGPYTDRPPPLTDAHRRIFFRESDAGNEVTVAREIIGRFAQRAFRRPVEKEELDRLVGLYQKSRQEGESHVLGVKHALTAVLVSPHFLFRGELQPEPDNPRSVHPINEYALASRLSYFLWSTMPDDRLFELAGQKKLRRNLAAEVKRMLADPRARALTDNFAGQWLQLRTLAIVAPDARKFPEFDPPLRQAMVRETEMLFEHIVKENRPVTEFLAADYTFLNERLARHYGIDSIRGDEFQRVSLAGTPRAGVLTHGSFLTLSSNPTRTSPVKRGKWVMENILGTPPPPPPPGVPPLEEKELKGTLRQRMEQHRENPACASCHDRMDSIGFGFEHFDAVGRYREKDGDQPVEPGGELGPGEKFADHRELTRLFSGPRQDDFLKCLTEKLFTYALGRGLEYYDRPAVEAAIAGARQGGLKFAELILGVVESVPFQKRRGEGEAPGLLTTGTP